MRRGRVPALLGVAAVLLAVGMCPSWAAAQSSASSSSGGARSSEEGLTREQQINKLDVAIERLVAEAKQLKEVKKLQNLNPRPTFNRPHPKLKGIEPQLAKVVLARMAKEYTGNNYRDTYVRWHMVYIAKRAPEGVLRESEQRILSLIRAMPGPVRLELKKEWRDVPKDGKVSPARAREIGEKYYQLRWSTRTTYGYPPFERRAWGREALKHMTPERREKMEPIVERMERLNGQFKRIWLPELVAYNERIRKVNWLVRQYRGELIYTLLLTGDPSVLERVVTEVAKQVKEQDRAALDILSFVNLAALNGVFHRYEPEHLRKVGEALEKIGRSAEGYETYKNGEFDLPRWAPRQKRNVADYIFHLVKMFQDGYSTFIPPTMTRGETDSDG